MNAGIQIIVNGETREVPGGLEVSALLLDDGQKPYQQPDSAGINHGDFGEVHDNASVPVAQCLLQSLAQTIHGRAHSEWPPELNHLHLRALTDVNVQTFLLEGHLKGGMATN